MREKEREKAAIGGWEEKTMMNEWMFTHRAVSNSLGAGRELILLQLPPSTAIDGCLAGGELDPALHQLNRRPR